MTRADHAVLRDHLRARGKRPARDAIDLASRRGEDCEQHEKETNGERSRDVHSGKGAAGHAQQQPAAGEFERHGVIRGCNAKNRLALDGTYAGHDFGVACGRDDECSG